MKTIRECLDRYLGIPYVHLGRTMQGLDCYGLIILVYRDLGFNLMDLDDYEKNWSLKGNDLFIENYQKQWERVEKPQLFDVVLFRGVKGVTNHAGIYLDIDRFLHCMEAGVVVGKFGDDVWSNIAGYFRIKR